MASVLFDYAVSSTQPPFPARRLARSPCSALASAAAMPAAWPPGRGPQPKFSAPIHQRGQRKRQSSHCQIMAKILHKEHGEARARLRTDLARAAAQAPPPRQTPRPLPPPRGAPQPALPSPAAFSRCCTAYTCSACVTSPDKGEGSIQALWFCTALWRVSDCPQLVICLFAWLVSRAPLLQTGSGALASPLVCS